MEPTKEAKAGAGTGVKPVAGPVVQIDEGRIQAHLDEVVRSTVEETLNAFLDAEEDRLCGARKYERSEGRKDGGYGVEPKVKPRNSTNSLPDFQSCSKVRKKLDTTRNSLPRSP